MCTTHLALDHGPLLHEDVFHKTINELSQVGILQCLGWDLEHHQVSAHEGLRNKLAATLFIVL